MAAIIHRVVRASMRTAICALVWAAVVGVAVPARAMQPTTPVMIALHLKDGSVLVGYVLTEDRDTIRFRSQSLGDVTLAAAEVVSRGPADVKAPAGVPAAEPAAPAIPSPWTRTIGVGAFWDSPPFTQGTIAGGPPAITGAELRLPGAQLHAEINLAASYTRLNRVMSLWGGFAFTDSEPFGRQMQATALGVQFMWPITPRTYWSSRATSDRDAVRHIDHEYAVLVGAGFKLLQGPALRVDVVGGGALLYEEKNTPFDNTYQPQVGAMESIVYRISSRASLSHWLVSRVGIREREIWSVESHTGLQGAITSWLSTDIALTWNYDNVLGDAITQVRANTLFPGSPALMLRASQKTIQRITSSLRVTF